MTLSQELANFRQQFLGQVDSTTLAIMNQATNDLIDSGIVDRTLKVGDKAPDFTLPNATGESINLQQLLQQGAVVLSFYRGGWCPYCNLELRALQQALPEIKALGANLITVSPQTPDNSLSTAEKNELTFEVLSDLGNKVAREYGLVFTLPEQLRPIYQNFGIDLPAYNGDPTFDLPIPATYVIAADGKVVLAFANADYTQRLEPTEIISTLQNLTVNV
ncbi:MAG: peroxiredoxin-like family protein [Pleurocapsa sp. MO_192.B19]|nr:peroxiredoxin-like family protein [Pleurocapsa sp. MO_192.B19]